MRTLFAGALALLVSFCLAACGGGQANTTPNATNTDGPKVNQPANEPEDKPQADPNAYKKIDGATPEGWHSMSEPGRNELYTAGIFKEPGADLKFVKGISTPKAPGPTEGDEEWEHWRGDVSAALLFHVSTGKDDLVAAMKKHGPALMNGFDAATVVLEDGMAGGGSEDERYFYAAVSNSLGTYIAVVVLASGEGHGGRAEQAIGWIESLKPQE